jgi:DNA-binding HxlR family transcriptional regulator
MQGLIRGNDRSAAAALAGLCGHAWSLRILDILQRRDGARFVELANLTGASRPRLAAALEALIAAGLVARNPGYGHPLRPEYVLTARGRRAAEPAGECVAVAGRWKDHTPLAWRKWPLPILHAIGGEDRRFSAVRSALPDATPRALSLGLANLSGAGLVRRDIVDDAPPAVLYRVARAARPMLPPLSLLAAALTDSRKGA